MRAGALVLGLALAASACGGSGSPDAAAAPPDQVTGVITDLRYDGEALTEFDVETLEDTYEILIEPERDYGFNLNHLRSHLEDELPVMVTLTVTDGDLYATDILDA